MKSFGEKREKELHGLNLTQKLKMLLIVRQMLILSGTMMELLMPLQIV